MTSQAASQCQPTVCVGVYVCDQRERKPSPAPFPLPPASRASVRVTTRWSSPCDAYHCAPVYKSASCKCGGPLLFMQCVVGPALGIEASKFFFGQGVQQESCNRTAKYVLECVEGLFKKRGSNFKFEPTTAIGAEMRRKLWKRGFQLCDQNGKWSKGQQLAGLRRF